MTFFSLVELSVHARETCWKDLLVTLRFVGEVVAADALATDIAVRENARSHLTAVRLNTDERSDSQEL